MQISGHHTRSRSTEHLIREITGSKLPSKRFTAASAELAGAQPAV